MHVPHTEILVNEGSHHKYHHNTIFNYSLSRERTNLAHVKIGLAR